MKSNLEIQSQRGWLILVHGVGTPSAEEWQRYIDLLTQSSSTLRGQLIHSLGGAPTSAQRARTIEIGKTMFAERKARGGPAPHTAVMTQSAAVRALATMFNWFFDNTFQGFRLDDWDGAFAHLAVPPADRDHLRATVASLKQQVAGGTGSATTGGSP